MGKNLWRKLEEVKRECAERLQHLAGPPEFAAVGAEGLPALGHEIEGAREGAPPDESEPAQVQSLPDSAQLAAVVEGGDVSSGQAQAAAEGATPADDEPCQARALPSLHSDFSGMRHAELRREAAKLHVRKRGAQNAAQLREACQRAVASQGTLHFQVQSLADSAQPAGAQSPYCDGAHVRQYM